MRLSIARVVDTCKWRRHVCAAMVAGALSAGVVGSLTTTATADSEATKAIADPARFPYELIFVRIPVEANEWGSPAAGDLEPIADIPPGTHIARYVPRDRSGVGPGDGRIVNLTPGFAAAWRPDLSFDGRRMLFVARRTPDDLPGVWEMQVDGTGVRQITSEAGPCSAALYLSTMYSMDAEEPLHLIAYCGVPDGYRVGEDRVGWGASPAGPASALFTCRLDGRRVRRITFSPHGVSDPLLLSDGRLVFSSWQSEEEPEASNGRVSSLRSIQPDGCDLFPFAAAHEQPRQRGMPCETADGLVVYIETADALCDGGALVAVDRARSLTSRRLVADDDRGRYHSPSALPDGDLLVAFRSNEASTFGLYRVEVESGARSGPIIDSTDWHAIDGLVVAPRREPAGRSTVVDERRATGFVYCLDAHKSDTRRGGPIDPGRIDQLRLWQAVVELTNRPADGQVTANSSTDDRPRSVPRWAVNEQLLGQAPVAPDGSFFLEVPARTPLRWELLDTAGAVLRSMDSWMWVMPRESRGCIGCHEDRELAPPNVHPLALRQTAQAVGIGAHDHGGHSHSHGSVQERSRQ
ncbi:MAG: hypothetical protein GY778_16855 [bacterium]|nr:hypothetical protein [bacterium]